MASQNPGAGAGLTRGDSLTIWTLLAHGESTERERLKSSGLSRTTYHESRRKVYLNRWLQDRYVPSPSLFGRSKVGFGLARPLADRGEEYLGRISSLPSSVLLWSLQGSALGVFFLRDSGEAERVSRVWNDVKLVSDAEFIGTEPSPGNIPAYFDYEGLWGHLSFRNGTVGYPRPLHSVPGAGNSVRQKGGEMLHEVSELMSKGEAVYLQKSRGLRTSQRHVVEGNWLVKRVLLGPRAVPPLDGRNANRILFITGTMVATVPPMGILSSLVTNAGVFPFLVAGGGGKAVVGLMGQSGTLPEQHHPSPFGEAILPALRPHLSNINVFQGEASTMVPILDHRYEKLAGDPQ